MQTLPKGWYNSSEIPSDNSVISEILKCLSLLVLKKSKRDENTKKVKSGLCTLGMKLKYSCYTNRLDSKRAEELSHIATEQKVYFKNTEWLYDLIWYKECWDYTISELGLAVESEWQYHRNKETDRNNFYPAVRYDFQKLVIGTAKINLMIFKQPKSKASATSTEELLKQFDYYVRQQLAKYQPKVSNRQFICVAYKHDMKSYDYKIFES
ncbi:MAG: hypothetical protein KBT45_00175 [Bacteroidales bacterium]|nr:hypothetical protein [Candidatus Colimorpha pelethequi]